jgi:rhamnosyltransferase
VKIIAVVVTYQPDPGVLDELLRALVPQVDSAVLVDNGSEAGLMTEIVKAAPPRTEIIKLGANRGIAFAQNAGIRWAQQRGGDFVLLMDHDSIPAHDMVARLLEVAHAKTHQGVHLAAVGPRYQDDRQHTISPFIRVQGLSIKRQECAGPDSAVPVDFLIASGCLIPMAAIDAVGMMNDALFIDYVDVEWGLRADKLGYRSFGACAAHMKHSIGEPPVVFLRRKFTVHSSVRHYYLFRNAVWLYLRSGLPRSWKLADGLRLVCKYAIYALLGRPKLAHIRMMNRGVYDAVRDRMGPLN